MQYIVYWGPQRPGSGAPQSPSAGPGGRWRRLAGQM